MRSTAEPSNGQMMQYTETMFARQEKTTKEFCDLITDRVQRTEHSILLVDSRLSDLHDRYRRLTELQAQLDNIEFIGTTTQDKEARDRLAKLEKDMKQDAAKMARLQAGDTARGDPGALDGNDPSEAPRVAHGRLRRGRCAVLVGLRAALAVLLAAWARKCVSSIKSAATQILEEGHEAIKVWATIRKTKEHQARNRRLMRTAAMFQQFNRLCSGMETYKLVCWRSGCVVVGGRRICRLTPQQTWEFSPNWFAPDVWTKNETFLREAATKILNDGIAASAGAV